MEPMQPRRGAMIDLSALFFFSAFLFATPAATLGQHDVQQRAVRVGDRFHITGCENGDLLLPLVNIWSQPPGSPGARPIATLSGQGRPDGAGRCQGAIVAALEVRTTGGRTHIKIESVVNGTIGWITDSFVGKKFDTDRCREHFTEPEHIRRCETRGRGLWGRRA